MASWTSGAMSTSGTYVKYTITITENSTNIVNNTSNVTVSVRFYRTNTGYTTYGTGTVYCAINGTTYSAAVTPSQKITNSGIVLFSKTLDIAHDSDGSKTLNTAAYISHNAVTSSSQSFSHALTTIARASQPSCITYPNTTYYVGDIGRSIMVHMNRASANFIHGVQYKWFNKSEWFATNVESNCWFSIPLDFCNDIPNDTSGWGTIVVETWNDGTFVGSKSVTFSATVPSSVKPSCSLTVSDEKGYESIYGGYIQGQSRLNVVVNTTQAYSSPIVAYSTSANGSWYSSQTFNTSVLSKSGTNTISTTVTDGRGRSGTASSNITVIPYSKPNGGLSVKRGDIDEATGEFTENDKGEHAKVTFWYSITSLSDKNAKTVKLQYKASSGSDWATINLDYELLTSQPEDWSTNYSNYYTYDETNKTYTKLSGDTAPEWTTLTYYCLAPYERSNGSVLFDADTGSSYEIQLIIEDSFTSTTSRTKLSTAYCLFHIPLSGKGITFGGVAEEDGFKVKMDAHFANGITEDIPVLLYGNCNELLTSGTYYIGNQGTNKPANGLNGWLTVKTYSTDYCHQRYVTYQGDEYQRIMMAGTWGAWRGVKPHITTTTINITANINAGASTSAYQGSAPTETGFTATRIGGYCNGEVLTVMPNGWIHNQFSVTKKPISVTWLWLMLPS